ncbi:MAG: hypothetical protein ACYC6L_05130 [Anaerolineae bacterium]
MADSNFPERQLPAKLGEPLILATSVPGKPDDPSSVKNSLLLRELGFTIFQTDTDHTSTNEIAPDEWDWADYDQALDMVRRVGGQWLLFPHFAFPPAWFGASSDFARLACLEHHQPIEAWSIWAPGVDAYYERGYKALAEHFGADTDAIRAFFLGIHGDYGEAVFPGGCRIWCDWQRRDWLQRFGNEHNHLGYWCDDPYARASYQAYLKKKYGTLSMVNLVAQSHWKTWKEIDYPADSALSRRAWLDFIQWYYDSMTDFASRVMAIARRHFPNQIMMLGLGAPDENLRWGQDNTRLPRAAAVFKVHARSTHGGFLPFPRNYTRVKRIATACKFYNTSFWTEPPSGIEHEREIARIFESVSCGSTGFWDWATNPLASPDVFRRYGQLLTYEKPVVDVAVFFPQTQHRLAAGAGGPSYPQRFEEGATAIRDVMDWDVLDEQLIGDGALAGYRVLVLFEGSVMESAALEQIQAWVEQGGLIVSLDFGPIESVEGSHTEFNELFGFTNQSRKLEPTVDAADMACEVLNPGFNHLAADTDLRVDGAYFGLNPDASVLAVTPEGAMAAWAMPHGKGYAVYFAGSWENRRHYYELLRDLVYHASALSPALKDAPLINDEWDGVYTTILEGNQILFYNQMKTRATRVCYGQCVTLEPMSLQKVRFQEPIH